VEVRSSVRSIKFFRLRLLSAEPAEIPLILKEYEQEAEALEDQLIHICWYMRGWDIHGAYASTPAIRKKAMAMIEKNIERTKETGLALL
jgi:hypothetical protein